MKHIWTVRICKEILNFSCSINETIKIMFSYKFSSICKRWLASHAHRIQLSSLAKDVVSIKTDTVAHFFEPTEHQPRQKQSMSQHSWPACKHPHVAALVFVHCLASNGAKLFLAVRIFQLQD